MFFPPFPRVYACMIYIYMCVCGLRMRPCVSSYFFSFRILSVSLGCALSARPKPFSPAFTSVARQLSRGVIADASERSLPRHTWRAQAALRRTGRETRAPGGAGGEEGAGDDGAAIRIPRGSKAAPCMLRAPRPRALCRALNNYPRYYLCRCPASFRFFRRVMSRPRDASTTVTWSSPRRPSHHEGR